MFASRHSDSTTDGRRALLSVFSATACVRRVQAALQTATAVVSSHELISCGKCYKAFVDWAGDGLRPSQMASSARHESFGRGFDDVWNGNWETAGREAL